MDRTTTRIYDGDDHGRFRLVLAGRMLALRSICSIARVGPGAWPRHLVHRSALPGQGQDSREGRLVDGLVSGAPHRAETRGAEWVMSGLPSPVTTAHWRKHSDVSHGPDLRSQIVFASLSFGAFSADYSSFSIMLKSIILMKNASANYQLHY